MTTLGKTLKKLRILRKELASIGFKLTIGKSEYLSTRRGGRISLPARLRPARRAHVMGGRELQQAEGIL